MCQILLFIIHPEPGISNVLRVRTLTAQCCLGIITCCEVDCIVVGESCKSFCNSTRHRVTMACCQQTVTCKKIHMYTHQVLTNEAVHYSHNLIDQSQLTKKSAYCDTGKWTC